MSEINPFCREIPVPARKAEYAGKLVLVKDTPSTRNKYAPEEAYPLRPGMVAVIDRRMNAAETRNGPMDVGHWGNIRVLRVRWICPTCESWHTGYLPESWIEEEKLAFVEIAP